LVAARAGMFVEHVEFWRLPVVRLHRGAVRAQASLQDENGLGSQTDALDPVAFQPLPWMDCSGGIKVPL